MYFFNDEDTSIKNSSYRILNTPILSSIFLTKILRVDSIGSHSSWERNSARIKTNLE